MSTEERGRPNVYTLISSDDGPLTFRTHVPPSRLTPENARRILDGLAPVLAELQAVAASHPTDEGKPSGRRTSPPGVPSGRR